MKNSDDPTSGGTQDSIPPSLAKRIRRRVVSRTHNLFAATAPGLERLCLSELLSLPLSDPQSSIVPGGVEFRGKLHDCYMANLYLRCANRVLMRLIDFHASGFATLEKKLGEIDWELFLPPSKGLRISAASSKSRLYHKNAVAQRIHDSVAGRMGPLPDHATGPGPHLFVRIDADRVTISLDSSGELLHKRGIKPRGGKAPIRETLAAAILKIADYRPGDLLLDPMCGSGTFSLEAAMMSRNIPGGWFRGFAFMEWPAFSPGRWRHLRREAEGRMVPVAAPYVFASDSRDSLIERLGENLAAAGLSGDVKLLCLDFFDLTPKRLAEFGGESVGITSRPGLLVLNPPYGRRLGSFRESRTLFTDIFKKLRMDFKGWRIAVVAPGSMLTQSMLTSFNQYSLLHGGLELMLLTGRV